MKKILFKNWPMLIWFFISLIITIVVKMNFGNGSFLNANDQVFWLNQMHLSKEIFALHSDSLGMPNIIQEMTNVVNAFFYQLLFKMNLSLQIVQLTQIFLCLMLLLELAFIGYGKLASLLVPGPQKQWPIIFVTLFFCFNPFTIIYLNAGLFWSFSNIISYATIPWAIYYLLLFWRKDDFSFTDSVAWAVVFFLNGISVLFLVPTIFTYITYSLFEIKKQKINWRKAKSLIWFVLCSALFYIFYLSSFVFDTINSVNAISQNLENAAGSNIQVGIPYMFKQYFAWTIYTPWAPKNIVTFSDYLLGTKYVVAVLSFYLLIVLIFLKRKDILVIAASTLAVYLVAIFFAKGPTSPAGFVYNYLINHFAIFSTIRTPDTKFGAIALASLATVLMIILASHWSKKAVIFIASAFAVLILVTIWPIFHKEAIIGVDQPGVSGKMITYESQDLLEAIDVINSTDSTKNVLIFPSESFYPAVRDGKIFVGRDIFPIAVSNPFLFLADPSRIDAESYSKINAFYQNPTAEGAQELASDLVVVKKDFAIESLELKANEFERKITDSGDFELVINNESVSVFRSKKLAELIYSQGGAEVEVNKISPVKYQISISNLSLDDTLVFTQSYNRFWKLYPIKDIDPEQSKFYQFSDVFLLGKRTNFDAEHNRFDGFSNSWRVSSEDMQKLQADGLATKTGDKYSLNLMIYYEPQILYYITMLISGLPFLAAIIYLTIMARRKA